MDEIYIEKEPLEIYLSVFKSRLRFSILKNLLNNKSLTSDELVEILEKQNISTTKPTIFRHLISLEEEGILIHDWDISKGPAVRAVKIFSVKKEKRKLIDDLIEMIK